MPFDKMKQYASDEGFCCPWALLVSRKRWSTPLMAEDARMSPRALRYWRRAARKGDIRCLNCKDCLSEKIKAARKTS